MKKWSLGILLGSQILFLCVSDFGHEEATWSFMVIARR